MNLFQAHIRNIGTCHVDAKGEADAGQPGYVRVPMRRTGAESLVVVLKGL